MQIVHIKVSLSSRARVSVWYSWPDFGRLTLCSYHSDTVPMAFKSPGRGTWEAPSQLSAPTSCWIETELNFITSHMVC